MAKSDPAALALAREFHPRFLERVQNFRLSDAQLTVARSYGYPSWPKLKAYLDAIVAYTRNPQRVRPQEGATDEFLRLACLTYGGDDIGINLFTALTGAFGSGEDAPNQPPHHQSIALARLLLEAGADANDDQTIYNRHFRPGNDYLELLLAHGLGKTRHGPWPKRLGHHLADPRQLLEDALVFVADNDDYAERVALLLEHGVDPDGLGTQHPALEGMRPIERAQVGGARRNFDLLLAAGAAPPAADPVDALIGLCMRDEREAVRRKVSRDPKLAAAAIERHPGALVDASERENIEAVALLAELGYDGNLRRQGQAALHLAAYAGNRELCELLLRLGADPNLEDNTFHARASGWARHAHHDELASWLEGVEEQTGSGAGG